MGKVIKIFSFLTIVLVLLTFVNRKIQKQKDPTLFKIYQASDYENIVIRVIGIVPRKFKEIYTSEIIESRENSYLKKIYRTSEVPLEMVQFNIKIENGQVNEANSVFIGLMGLDLLPM